MFVILLKFKSSKISSPTSCLMKRNFATFDYFCKICANVQTWRKVEKICNKLNFSTTKKMNINILVNVSHKKS